MQIVPIIKFAWNVKSCFLEKNKKKYHQIVIYWISLESGKGLKDWIQLVD